MCHPEPSRLHRACLPAAAPIMNCRRLPALQIENTYMHS
jgi:hypothetical protein